MLGGERRDGGLDRGVGPVRLAAVFCDRGRGRISRKDDQERDTDDEHCCDGRNDFWRKAMPKQITACGEEVVGGQGARVVIGNWLIETDEVLDG